jgi:hypothetical protein
LEPHHPFSEPVNPSYSDRALASAAWQAAPKFPSFKLGLFVRVSSGKINT